MERQERGLENAPLRNECRITDHKKFREVLARYQDSRSADPELEANKIRNIANSYMIEILKARPRLMSLFSMNYKRDVRKGSATYFEVSAELTSFRRLLNTPQSRDFGRQQKIRGENAASSGPVSVAQVAALCQQMILIHEELALRKFCKNNSITIDQYYTGDVLKIQYVDAEVKSKALEAFGESYPSLANLYQSLKDFQKSSLPVDSRK